MPEWSETYAVESALPHTVENGYVVLRGEWGEAQTTTLTLDMRIRETHPITWDTDVVYTRMEKRQDGIHIAFPETVTHCPEDDRFISISRGPLTLAADSRTGKDAASTFAFARAEDGSITASVCDTAEIVSGTPCTVRCRFTAPDGSTFDLVDYASAGRDWETVIAAWLPIE